MSLTAKNKPYRKGFGPFAPEVHRAPMAYPYRWPTGPVNCAEEAADALTDLLDRQVGAENVAAVLVEPIQGRADSSFRLRGSFPASPRSAGPALADALAKESASAG